MSAEPFDDPQVAPHNTLAEQKTLGKYVIERKLGAGGMGAVYLARDSQLRRPVALKILPRDKANNPTLVKRFRAEAQAAAQLRHDNVVMVYETGEVDGFLYIAMEYVEGVDVHDLIFKRGRIPVKRSIEMIKQTASALQHAYEQNIVHRDIKPSNLLVRRDGLIKLTDLGLARSIDDTVETNITRAGTTVGTVDYMSPEQARDSKAADIRSDLYSLGCTWYHMLTGQAPFGEGSLTNKLQAHATKPPPDPRALNPDVTEGIVSIIHRMMAKKPADRYQTPKELLADLNRSALTKGDIASQMLRAAAEDDEGLLDEGRKSSPAQKRSARNSFDLDDEAPVSRSGKSKRVSSANSGDDDWDVEEDAPDQPSKTRSGANRRVPSEDSPSGKSRSRGSRDVNDDEDHSQGSRENSTKSVAKSKTKANSLADQNEASGERRQPARMKSKQDQNDDESSAKPKLDTEWLKYLIWGGIPLAVLLAIGLITAQLGKGVTVSPGIDLTKKPVVEPSPTTNSGNPDKPPTTEGTPGNTVAANDAGTNSTEKPGPPPIASPVIPGKKPDSFNPEAIPKWIEKLGSERGSLAQFTVGVGTPSATHFNSLAEAIQTAPAAGVHIRLQGTMIFPLPVTANHDLQKLFITANADEQPIIALIPQEQTANAVFRTQAKYVELEGVHLSADRSRHPPGANITLLGLTDGSLRMRNCSISLTGSGAVTGVSVANRPMDPGISSVEPVKILIENCCFRGPELTGLLLNLTACEVVIRNSLFATGRGPAIKLDGNVSASSALMELPDEERVQRAFRISQSTFLGSLTILDFEPSDLAKRMPARTAIAIHDSILASPGQPKASCMLRVGTWPQRPNRGPTQGRMFGLGWFGKHNLQLGFEELINLGPDSPVHILDSQSWQRSWAHPQEQVRIEKESWSNEFTTPQTVGLPEFSASKLPQVESLQKEGSLPGCDVTRLASPLISALSRVAALSNRPRFPMLTPLKTIPPATIVVDLSKEDLGFVLGRPTLVDGSVVLCKGKGLAMMTPVTIRDKSVTLLFQQLEGGAPLTIMPKVNEPTKDAPKPGSEPEAMITINNGTLEVRNAQFANAPNLKPGTPRFHFSAKNANLYVRESLLWGPTSELPSQQGLIFVDNSVATGTASEPRVVVVQSSMLTSYGTAIVVQSANARCFVNQSVVIAKNDGLAVSSTSGEPGIVTTVDVQDSAFATGKAALRFTAAVPSSSGPTIRAFIDRNAFFASPGGSNESAWLATNQKTVIENSLLDYWGTRNGIAPDVKHWLRLDDNKLLGTGPAEWSKHWGLDRDHETLQGAGGTLLADNLPSKWPAYSQLKPAAMTIHNSSKAATWSPGGKPIGPDVKILENIGPLKTIPTSPTTPTTPNTPPPTSNRLPF